MREALTMALKATQRIQVPHFCTLLQESSSELLVVFSFCNPVQMGSLARLQFF